MSEGTPASAAVGAIAAFIALLGDPGVLINAVLGGGAVLAMFIISRRNVVGHHNVSEVAESATAVLRRNLLVFGLGGVVAPFVGIKLIDLAVTAMGVK